MMPSPSPRPADRCPDKTVERKTILSPVALFRALIGRATDRPPNDGGLPVLSATYRTRERGG